MGGENFPKKTFLGLIEGGGAGMGRKGKEPNVLDVEKGQKSLKKDQGKPKREKLLTHKGPGVRDCQTVTKTIC